MITVKLTNLANNYVIADAIRLERIPGPTLQVFDAGSVVSNGSGIVNLGTAAPGSVATKTLTVRNIGSGTLTLGALSSMTGFSSSGFASTTLTANDGMAGGTDETTLTVTMSTASTGTKSSLLSFTTNDSLSSSYSATVTGIVANPVRIVDDAQAATSFGSYSQTSGFQYFQDGVQGYAEPGTSKDVEFAAGSSLARN